MLHRKPEASAPPDPRRRRRVIVLGALLCLLAALLLVWTVFATPSTCRSWWGDVRDAPADASSGR